MDRNDHERRKPRLSPRKFERMQWEPSPRERKTTTDYLALALRTAIHDGQFDDNEELNQVELAEYFGVSRVPIREALRQLQAEGLVQSIAHHRTVVTGLTLSQILEAIEMRAVLEHHLLKKACKRFDTSDIDRLRKICEETDQIKDYSSRWVVKNWEFHSALYNASESPMMIDAVERLHLRVERYARRAGTRERLRQAASEHWEILHAIQGREFAKAGALLERHITHTGEDISRAREIAPVANKASTRKRKGPAVQK